MFLDFTFNPQLFYKSLFLFSFFKLPNHLFALESLWKFAFFVVPLSINKLNFFELFLRVKKNVLSITFLYLVFQTSYKAFSHELVKLLAHDSRTVVISSLVLVGYLEERLRDTVRRDFITFFVCILWLVEVSNKLLKFNSTTE